MSQGDGDWGGHGKLYNMHEKKLEVQEEKCPQCGGKGMVLEITAGDGPHAGLMTPEDCPICNGTGKIPREKPCPQCRGTGEVYAYLDVTKERCSYCNGKGKIPQEEA